MRWQGAVIFGAAVAGPVAAQRPASSVGAVAVLVAGERIFVGLGPGLMVPLGSEVEMTARTVLGRRAGQWGVRGEATAGYRIPAPRGQRRRWYLVGGIAAATGHRGGPYLQVGVGVDLRRLTGPGPFVELGAGGGFRLATGVRADLNTQTAAPRGRP